MMFRLLSNSAHLTDTVCGMVGDIHSDCMNAGDVTNSTAELEINLY